MNAIWNIETAATFLYGAYILLEYSNAPSNMTLPFPEWITENKGFFILIIIFFSVISVARAGYSVAEIFKSPIIKIFPVENNISPSVTLKKQAANKNRPIRKKKK